MAWYYGTFACGHEGRTNITGPTKDRERIKDSRFSGNCEECKVKMREAALEAEREEAVRFSKEIELVKLEGTEKQVEWAEVIRKKMIENFDKINEELIELYVFGQPKYEEIRHLTLDDYNKIKHHIINSKVKASYYINNRDLSSFGYAFKEYKDALKTEEQQLEDMRYELIKQESTIFPENKITNAVAEIEVDDNEVSVSFERNDDFYEIVKKKLHYEWSTKRYKWVKKITETTGTAEERAAELGNVLLNAGFPVMILDDEIRENAVNGDFEPECKRWIYKRKDKQILAIKWSGYNDELYRKAMSLPGAEWSSPYVIVNVAHHNEVDDFSYLYGFKFTKSAREMIEKYKERLKEIETIEPVKVNEEGKTDGLDKILESSDEILDDLKD